MADAIVISIAVVLEEDTSKIPLIADVFARAAAGLALEGITVCVNFGTVKEEEKQ